MSEVPGDVTLGEVWRGQRAIADRLEQLADQVSQLPAALSAALDARSVERVEALRREITRQFERRDERVALLQRIVYGAVALVLLTVGTAILALVLIRPT